MDKFKAHFFQPKPVEEILDTATIVVDTNVLLSAYQWKEALFTEVLQVLEKSSSEGRLKIPMHVIEEFMDQRPKMILAVIDRINTDIFTKLQKPKGLELTVPLISLLENYSEYSAIEEEYMRIYKLYRKKIENLSSELKDFFTNDPVLKSLKSIIENSSFTNIDKLNKEFLQEANDRLTQKKPPLAGGDAGKKENKFGDFFIWKDILSINNDVIFVSTDFKEDWYYLDKTHTPLSPRRELIEEFFEINNGKTCSIISLVDYMKIAKPTLEESLIKDLENSQDINNDIFRSGSFEQVFELTYLVSPDGTHKTIAYDLYSFLYFNFDVKTFAHSEPYLESHKNKYEYMYIKFISDDGKITPGNLMKQFISERGDKVSYKLVEIQEVNLSASVEFTYLNG